MSENSKDLRKVYFRLIRDEDGYPPADTESVWAARIGDGQYKIDNIPFFSRDATLGDVVEVTEEDDRLWYRNTIEESANSLIRVVCYGGKGIPEVRSELTRLGCTTEWSESHHLIAVSIPGTVLLESVQQYLRGERAKDLLGFEEPILRQ
jgi:hypothetical protein